MKVHVLSTRRVKLTLEDRFLIAERVVISVIPLNHKTVLIVKEKGSSKMEISARDAVKDVNSVQMNPLVHNVEIDLPYQVLAA